ncbi:DUF6215 domain-containing protein [Streptomyces sp. B1I3]|uniref:DUF6215 domain-containing protein n=1 Tax=Streptomyces sp. B1I3 TaxID=3042264 RepID=UPI00278781AC|nr:DUF6215 domain-containing protein [Streptomyces sp. B1I3]MDQ0792212.1 hypothetical protein [Streptomyces sp. B1I3]
MLGFLLRLLPFWVREPLLILVGSVLGVRITYLAISEHNGTAACLGVVFLVFTAIRVHTVVRALRARRRRQSPAASPDGAVVDTVTPAHAPAPAHIPAYMPAAARAQVQGPVQALVQAPAPAGAGPRPGPDTPVKEPNAWGQAVAAVAVFGALAAALWFGPRVLPSDDSTPQPVSCPGGEHEKLPKAYTKTPQAVTGDELCEALNRPDLAQLLGTPEEAATTVSGTSNTAPLTDGNVAQPEAEVTFDTYTVNFSATYNELSTAQYVQLMKSGGENLKTLTVLGRPAFFSSEHTMRLELDLGSEGSSGPVEQGPLARTLSVAFDRKDRGGYYDITVWSSSGALPDDGVLLDIADAVLPTIPERTAR